SGRVHTRFSRDWSSDVCSADLIFNVFNGRLTAWRRWNGGTPVQLGSISLNTAQHRFLRLRESAGRVYYETSADGAQWTTRWNVEIGRATSREREWSTVGPAHNK